MAGVLRVSGVVVCRVLERLNRFVVLVERDGVVRAHTNNTSSMRGLLVRGRRGYCLPRSDGKTRYRLIALEELGFNRAALIDTSLQMRAFEESIRKNLLPWLQGCSVSRRNPRVGHSVLDYLLSCNKTRVFVEVKSATLRLEGDRAAYPEPASMRGRRHVLELTELAKRGEKALLVFIAGLPRVRAFTLNVEADPLLPELVKHAIEAGVTVKAIAMSFEPETGWIVLENPDLRVEL
ncbi:MAG: DNA/RNA nuclease SfsA [Pyrodictiaceae archaeon]